ncbi:MAG TPA: type II toxin-antitoxin system VapC family toxin [Abditibacteriaceae bacterium]|jgi:PIN domain nuclease of toxin-antitoxin system
MNYLLDTHSFLWFISGDAKLSPQARLLMEEENNRLFISIASLWEMAIKFSLGKLVLNQPFEQMFPAQLEANSIEILAITIEHLNKLSALPFHHRDPFDRLLIAQSLSEGLPLISADTIFDNYGVQRQW